MLAAATTRNKREWQPEAWRSVHPDKARAVVWAKYDWWRDEWQQLSRR
jgi:hypothetical protein